VISIVACCHNVRLCALAARAFRSQQYYAVLLQITINLAQSTDNYENTTQDEADYQQEYWSNNRVRSKRWI